MLGNCKHGKEEGFTLVENEVPAPKCTCAYCKEGMSKSLEEHMDRRIALTKRLREALSGK